MIFKNVTCLTKVTDNQTKTTRTEDTIYFNDSTIELKGKEVFLDIKDREVVFIASSKKDREIPVGSNKPVITVTLDWVNVFQKENTVFKLPNNVTDILIVTREIYESLLKLDKTDSEIYVMFKEKGLGQMSLELTDVVDFSALTSYIVVE